MPKGARSPEKFEVRTSELYLHEVRTSFMNLTHEVWRGAAP